MGSEDSSNSARSDERIGAEHEREQFPLGADVVDHQHPPEIGGTFVAGRRRFDDLVAGVGQQAADRPDRPGDPGVGRAAGGIGHHGDPQALAVVRHR